MGPLKILVADDDEDILNMIRTALLPENYAIVVARDGVEAFEMARAERPDLIVLDIEMPRRNGYETCRLLRADPLTQKVPIIMLTSRSSEKDIVEGFEGGAQDYITKPFSLAHLRARVRTWLLRAENPEGRAG
jgi:DNA-binding response OmpR family regulator